MMRVQTKKIRIFLLSFGSFLFLLFAVQKTVPMGEVCNTGVGLGVGTARLSAVGWILFGLFVFFMWNSLQKTLSLVAIGMMLAGAVSNSLDRIRFGCTPDPFPFFGFFWFNGADVLITLGAALFILSSSLRVREAIQDHI